MNAQTKLPLCKFYIIQYTFHIEIGVQSKMYCSFFREFYQHLSTCDRTNYYETIVVVSEHTLIFYDFHNKERKIFVSGSQTFEILC